LVRGNHDQHAGDPPAEWRVACLDEPVIDRPFVWRHFPEAEAAGYTVAGHWHPAVRLGRGAFGVTLPCFYFGEAMGILPAFGSFTGTAVVQPRSGDAIYVLAEDEIILMQE
jgi:metallophosphoesterase superfamily enzyme